MTRLLALVAGVVFIGGFGFLTAAAVRQQGLTLAGLLSIFILVLLAVGIIGTLRNPRR